MKTSEMINEFQNELDKLSVDQAIESSRNALIESGIFAEDDIKKIDNDKLKKLGELFCEKEYQAEKQRLDIQSKIAGTYDYYKPIEQRANVYTNSKEYVVLSGHAIPNTSKTAKRDYIRFDLTMPAEMVSASTNKGVEVNYIYIGVMRGGELKSMSTFIKYINEGVFPNDNETFVDIILNKIMQDNERTEILLTQYGEPLVMMSDINNMYSSDYNNFFLNFLPFAQRTGVLDLLKTLKIKKQ